MKHKTLNKRNVSRFMLHASGFSLLETTVAVSILVVAIIGPLTLASSSLRSSSLAKNNLIAANLAQEGIELVRTKRSNNVLEGKSWIAELAACFAASGCAVEVANLNIASCGPTCPQLNFDASVSLYTYESGLPSIFTRRINLANVSGNSNEVNVKSTLSWQDQLGPHNFVLEEFMLDWQ